METQVPELKDRKRKIDVSSMTKDQLDSLLAVIGPQINEILATTLRECSAILNPIGLELRLAYEVLAINAKTKETSESEKSEQKQEVVETAKKRGRPKKSKKLDS